MKFRPCLLRHLLSALRILVVLLAGAVLRTAYDATSDSNMSTTNSQTTATPQILVPVFLINLTGHWIPAQNFKSGYRINLNTPHVELYGHPKNCPILNVGGSSYMKWPLKAGSKNFKHTGIYILYIYIYTHTRISMHICVCTCICIYSLTRTYTCIHTHMNTNLNTHRQIYICVYIYT